jgi:MFS transporter, DHA2 family, multidrug resistance protein
MSAAEATQDARPDYYTKGWTGGKNPWAIALVVTMATFMEVLDTSIANVSLPHIAGNLSVTQEESTWVLTSYLVANAIVLPISGWFANRFGRKRFYMTCVALFTISSFLCGIAPTLGALIFFRVLQGVGGGGLGPSEQAILADTFPPEKRGPAFAVYGMAVVFAPAIGPTLGGYITDHFTWRWVFFINIPVGILSLFLSQRMVTDPPYLAVARERARAGTVDWTGLGLIAAGLGCLEVVLDKGQEDDWFHSGFITVFLIIAVVALIAFVTWEWRQKHPVVDVKMFKSRSFATTNLMMLTVGLTLYSTTVLLPQYVQVLMGYTAELAGLALSPGGFTVMLLMPLVGQLSQRVDARKMLFFGFAVVAWSLFYMATHLELQMDFVTVMKLRVYQSIGLAFMFLPINILAYIGVPPEKNNAVSGVINLSRNMGGDIGIAFVTTLIARRSQTHQAYLVSDASPYHAVFSQRVAEIAHGLEQAGFSGVDATRRASAAVYHTLIAQAVTLSYIDAFWMLGVAALFMLPLIFVIRKNQPGQAGMGGH